MLRRVRLLRLPEHFKDKNPVPWDRTGRFSIDEAAVELGLDADYTRALQQPVQRTFFVKGRKYPGESGRSSRPGAVQSTGKKLFPLYQKNASLHKKLRMVDPKLFSTF